MTMRDNDIDRGFDFDLPFMNSGMKDAAGDHRAYANLEDYMNILQEHLILAIDDDTTSN